MDIQQRMRWACILLVSALLVALPAQAGETGSETGSGDEGEEQKRYECVNVEVTHLSEGIVLHPATVSAIGVTVGAPAPDQGLTLALFVIPEFCKFSTTGDNGTGTPLDDVKASELVADALESLP